MELVFKRNNRVEEDQEGLSRSFKHCVHAQQQRPSAWCNNRDQSNHIHIFWHYFICSSSSPSTFHRRCLSCVLLFLFMLKKKISKLFLICAQPQNIQSKVIKTLSIMGQGKRSQPIPAKKKVRNHFSDCRLRAVQPFDVSSRFLISMQFGVFFSFFLSLLSFCRAHIDDSAALCSAISYIFRLSLARKIKRISTWIFCNFIR